MSKTKRKPATTPAWLPWLLGGLALVVGFLGVYLWMGDPAPKLVGGAPAEIAASGVFQLEFPQPMQHKSVEAAFTAQPAVTGRFQWVGNMLTFHASIPLKSGQTYTFTLDANASTGFGRKLGRTLTWVRKVRAARVVVLGSQPSDGELWSYALDGSGRTQLTQSSGKVVDYQVSVDGEWIAYATLNREGGTDLWVVDRDGKNAASALSCGAESCFQPAWSPDGLQLAYTRQPGLYLANSTGKEHIWVMNTKTHQTSALFVDTQYAGTNSSWAPDGNKLASYDATTGGLRVLNETSNQSVVLPTTIQQPGAWSPDGSSLAFLTEQTPTGSIVPVVSVSNANFDQQTIAGLFEKADASWEFSLPAWNPDGQWLVAGQRVVGQNTAKQLVLMRPDGSDAQVITHLPGSFHAAYSWDPGGEYLLYQRLDISTTSVPEILIWQRSTGQTQRITANAGSPSWLP